MVERGRPHLLAVRTEDISWHLETPQEFRHKQKAYMLIYLPEAETERPENRA